MTYDEFYECCTNHKLPKNATPLETSLYEDFTGDWDTAHSIAQDVPSALGSAVHAYLHRKEGDLGNANYWYSRASRSEYRGSLDQEWEALAREVTA